MMPICKRCGDKGFVESWHGGAGGWTASLQQCPVRCNIKGYSEEVQKRLSPGYVTKPRPLIQVKANHVPADVIPIRKASVAEFNGA